MSNDGVKSFSTQKSKLPDQVRRVLRTRLYNKRTEEACVCKDKIADAANGRYTESHNSHEHDNDKIPETARLVGFLRKVIENTIELICGQKQRVIFPNLWLRQL
ncbi:MAG: hypothetical protein GXO75_21540 [Calditrichaeota bacterium]|nr:hypothetical protein [Calditrichota bacterium]